MVEMNIIEIQRSCSGFKEDVRGNDWGPHMLGFDTFDPQKFHDVERFFCRLMICLAVAALPCKLWQHQDLEDLTSILLLVAYLVLFPFHPMLVYLIDHPHSSRLSSGVARP